MATCPRNAPARSLDASSCTVNALQQASNRDSCCSPSPDLLLLPCLAHHQTTTLLLIPTFDPVLHLFLTSCSRFCHPNAVKG